MPIRGLKQDDITEFKGKVTACNLTVGEPGTLLAAKNVIILDDSQLRRCPGYTLVGQVGFLPIQAICDFQRDVDQRQYLIVQSGGSIVAMNADCSGQVVLSTGETASHEFVKNAFALYSSNGVTAWRYVDVAGTLTKYQWGITAPVTAPAIALSAGTLTLTYGRTYVYCFVSKYTDSLGIQRVSVSAPSPISAHTGPIANEIVTLSTFQVSTDPQVNFKWIFEVSDSPIDTSATYYFAAEIPNSQTTYGDALLDSALDQTRLAPFDNNPAPPAPLLTMFQNRIVAVNLNLIQLSGYSEITLGIPEEAWPISLFFDLPSGKRTATAVAALQSGTMLTVCTEDYWYAYLGYDATTFTEQDRVASPGAAGARALCMTNFGLAYLSKSRRIWLWSGTGSPTDISSGIAKLLYGTYTMEDLDATQVANAVLRWYEYGSLQFLAVFCRTVNSPDANMDLIQLWTFAVNTSASSGMYGGGSAVYGQLKGISQTDKVPSVTMTMANNVEVGDIPYLYMGDAEGFIYRFPDGFLDNGNPSAGVAQLAWGMPNEGKSRFYWLDVTTDRADSLFSFGIYATVADAPDQRIPPTQLAVQQLPSPVNQSSFPIRASLNAQGLATGRYITLYIAFPQDGSDAVVSKVTLASRALNAGIA